MNLAKKMRNFEFLLKNQMQLLILELLQSELR